MAIRATVRLSEEKTITVGNIDYLLVPNPRVWFLPLRLIESMIIENLCIQATLDSSNPDDVDPRLSVVYVTKPSDTISKSALQEFRRSILDRDDVFQADFLANIIFYGAKEDDVKIESDAIDELRVWKTRNWSFVEGRPGSKVAPGPYVLLHGTD